MHLFINPQKLVMYIHHQNAHFIFSLGHAQISNPKILAQINFTPDEIHSTIQF